MVAHPVFENNWLEHWVQFHVVYDKRVSPVTQVGVSPGF